jgi:hypothetical protein
MEYMKRLIAAASTLLLVALLAVLLFQQTPVTPFEVNPPYIGVAFGGNTVEQAKAIIDRTKNYTNLFIVQSGPVSINETALTEICDYAYQSGLNLIVYFGDLSPRLLAPQGLAWRNTWVINAKAAYGEQLLGIYYYDEPGGIFLDTNKTAVGWGLFDNETYDSVAERFKRSFQREQGIVFLKNASIPMYCSDYALYWFDYHFGYDVVFAEVGWNNTRIEKEIALVRGAANFQQKDWGIIVTWTNTQPPYLESGPKIYEQMQACYEAGAKYLTIFNYPYEESGGYGIMEDEHFEALEQIWADIAEGKITQKTKPEAVLILPQNYGFGLRSADDTIWGFWEPDENSAVIWDKAMQLLETYGYKLDIAYDDPDYTLPEIYSAVYYWNSTLP